MACVLAGSLLAVYWQFDDGRGEAGDGGIVTSVHAFTVRNRIRRVGETHSCRSQLWVTRSEF